MLLHQFTKEVSRELRNLPGVSHPICKDRAGMKGGLNELPTQMLLPAPDSMSSIRTHDNVTSIQGSVQRTLIFKMLFWIQSYDSGIITMQSNTPLLYFVHCVLHLIHAYCSHVAVKSVGLLTIFDSKISLCFLPEFIGASLFLGSHHSPILAISETPRRLWMLCNSLGHTGQFLTWTLTCKIWNLFLYMSVIT